MIATVSATALSYEPNGVAGHERYAGVRALWIKVIIRAVFDWVSYRDSNRLMQRKLAESAELWLFKENDLFNGFENVCSYLDVDPSLIRRWAGSMSREQVAKIEHLDRDQRVVALLGVR